MFYIWPNQSWILLGQWMKQDGFGESLLGSVKFKWSVLYNDKIIVLVNGVWYRHIVAVVSN